MKYTEVLNKKAFTWNDAKSKAVQLWGRFQSSMNDGIRTNYTEPQVDAAIDRTITRIGEYAPSVLAGAGIAGIATHSISEWLNEKRKTEGYQGEALPTRLLTALAAIGGGIGGGYLYDKYVKTAAYGDLPTEVTPDMEVPEEEQEELTDPSGKKKKKNKKKQLPENIQQMIYAQNAKKRREHIKEASLTYSKVAELMDSTSSPTPGQEWDSTHMAFANPGVSFMWDDEKRQYMPVQYDAAKKTNVPYTGKINQPAPLTPDQRWDRKTYIRSKRMPMTTTTNDTTTTTQGQGTFSRGQFVPQQTNFTTPNPVTPVQTPVSQYRQPDNKVEDVEGFR